LRSSNPQRLRERLVYARAVLGQSFDFTVQESYAYQRDQASWAQSEAEIQDLWRRRVKNDWLRLKLAGKDDKAIRATLEKSYDYALANLKKLKGEDVFQLFMNAYATSIEPHTNYLGPKATEDFDISMRLSLVGIGAVLQERDDMTVIRELVPGGPAAQSGSLKVGDRIVGVAQAQDAAPTDILGWRLDDVVRIIRGGDSVVKLMCCRRRQPRRAQRVVTLKATVSLEQQAKKSILEVKDGERVQRIGVIALPTFYQDFEARAKGDKSFKSATRDVARLLEELKKERVDSVLIDLRDNGGGSLNEAVELSNLFIGSGPVVQQRDARGALRVEGNNKASVAWDGQLGVLINRGSASASEIFAAAMQDYGRALIIGEPSFAKARCRPVNPMRGAKRQTQVG
jgi:carboxyl-terminal processing protease